MLHVLAYDSDRRQVLLRLDGRDFTHLDFLGKFFGQHGTSQIGVGIAHTDRSRIFRRRLRYEEHADAVFGQRLKDAVVHTDNAYHTQTLDRDQRGVVDGRDTLDGLALRIGHLLLDDGSFAFGVEGILDKDGDVLVANGVDRGRIDHLGAEVTQLRSLHIAQLVDGVGSRDDARIGSHEAVHVGPYLQRVGVESGCDDGGRIVRPAPSQVGHVACRHVGGNEARHQRTFGQVGKGATHQSVGQFLVEHMLGKLFFRLDELARVKPFGSRQLGSNDRRNALAVAHDGIRRFLRQVFDEVDTLEDIFQLVQQFAHLMLQFHLLRTGRKSLSDHLHMAEYDFTETILVRGITSRRFAGSIYQLVRNASQSRNNHNHRLVCGLYYLFDAQNAFCGTY